MKNKKFLLAGVFIFLFAGYSNVMAQLDLSDTIRIDEVVVTGTRTEVARKNVPLTISSVSEEQIELSNESAVLPILSQRIPGMFVTEKGVTGFGVANGSAGQISMRGVGGTAPNTQVLVLIDGHPQFQGLFSHPLPDAYVSSDVEKVEVVRGPASILYGSNAMAGAINIITKKQEEEGFSGNAKISYGSYNTQKYMASGGVKKGAFNIFASVNHNRTDGHRDTSEFKIVNGYLKAGVELNENIDIMADVSIADFNSQDPGTIYDPAFFGIDILRGKTSLSVKNRYEKVEGGLIGFYNFGNHEFTDGWISEDYHAGVSLYQGFQLFTGNRVTVGLDYKKVGGIANSGVPDGADTWHEVTDFAGYSYIQQSLFEKLILSAGLRLENSSIFGLETIPQAGFSFLVTENTTFKGSYSKGFRSPSLMELYLFAPNPELEPERLTNFELGVGRQSNDGSLKADLSVFAIDGTNVIEVRPNDNPPPPVKRQNVGSFSNKGVEIEVNWQVSNRFNLASNYSYLHIDKPRLAAPRHQFYINGTYSKNKFRANVSLQQIAGLYILTDDNPVTENYTLANLMLSYQFTKYINFYVSGKNLLDQSYSVNYGYPMPGITFFTGFNISI
ncbi:MAG: TonB-dependent receptor plug domain-containing protein [Tangfeifania sp.]